MSEDLPVCHRKQNNKKTAEQINKNNLNKFARLFQEENIMQENNDNKDIMQNSPVNGDTDNEKIKDVLIEQQSKIIKEINMDINSEKEINAD